MHNRNQQRSRPDGSANRIGIDHAGGIDRKVRNEKTLPLQKRAGTQHSSMLDRGSDDMIAAGPACHSRAFQYRIIALGTPARKDNLLRLGSYATGNRFPGTINALCRFFAPVVGTQRVTIDFRKIRQHRLHHLGMRRRCRCVIKIHFSHGEFFLHD
jgi:hypothetical protein